MCFTFIPRFLIQIILRKDFLILEFKGESKSYIALQINKKDAETFKYSCFVLWTGKAPPGDPEIYYSLTLIIILFLYKFSDEEKCCSRD